MSESKVKIYRSDLALLSHQYDIRVNAATEESEEKRSPQFYEKWTMGRYIAVTVSIAFGDLGLTILFCSVLFCLAISQSTSLSPSPLLLCISYFTSLYCPSLVSSPLVSSPLLLCISHITPHHSTVPLLSPLLLSRLVSSPLLLCISHITSHHITPLSLSCLLSSRLLSSPLVYFSHYTTSHHSTVPL
jgi:hypothetical protein